MLNLMVHNLFFFILRNPFYRVKTQPASKVYTISRKKLNLRFCARLIQFFLLIQNMVSKNLRMQIEPFI